MEVQMNKQLSRRVSVRLAGTLGLLVSATLAASAADAVALRLVDYWGDEPARTIWRTAYNACGDQIGATINVESEPGNYLVPKALQMVASKALPDVLMFDNPDMQQVAVSGALIPLSEYKLDTTGFLPGILSAG